MAVNYTFMNRAVGGNFNAPLNIFGVNIGNKGCSATEAMIRQDFVRMHAPREVSAAEAADSLDISAEAVEGRLRDIRKVYKKNKDKGCEDFVDFLSLIKVKVMKTFIDITNLYGKNNKYKVMENKLGDKLVKIAPNSDGSIKAQVMYAKSGETESVFLAKDGTADAVEVTLVGDGNYSGYIRTLRNNKKRSQTIIKGRDINFELPKLNKDK